MRKVTITFQGMPFTFSVAGRAKHTTTRGNVVEWVKVAITRDATVVDYTYCKSGSDIRRVANKWLQGAC